MMPSAPRVMSHAASSFASIVITASPSHASARLLASRAPSSMSARLLPGLRLYTVTSCPALTRLAAITVPMCPSPINPIFMACSVSIGQIALQRRHELGADGIGDYRVHDALNQHAVSGTERPACDLERRLELIRVPPTPKCDANPLVQHPAHRRLDYVTMKAALGEFVELPHCLEILGEAGRLEFWVDATQIVAVEYSVRSHAPAQRAATECAIAQGCDAVGLAIGQNLRFNAAFEQVVRRLKDMQRGHFPEALDLSYREIADADGADLALFVKRSHRLGGFLHRHQGVRPMNLIDVDVIGAQATQRLIDFSQDPLAGGVPIDLAVAPFQSRLGGDDGLSAHAVEGGADDFLGRAEAIDRRRIDQINALIQGRMNRGDRFALVAPTPHPAAHRPCAECHARHLQLGLWNLYEFGFGCRYLKLSC